MQGFFIVFYIGAETDDDILFDWDFRRNGGEKVTECFDFQIRTNRRHCPGDFIQEKVELGRLKRFFAAEQLSAVRQDDRFFTFGTLTVSLSVVNENIDRGR